MHHCHINLSVLVTGRYGVIPGTARLMYHTQFDLSLSFWDLRPSRFRLFFIYRAKYLYMGQQNILKLMYVMKSVIILADLSLLQV